MIYESIQHAHILELPRIETINHWNGLLYEYSGDDVNEKLKSMVLRDSVRTVAAMTRNEDVLCLDIERWVYCPGCTKRRRSMSRYHQVLEWFRQENTHTKIGFWARLPNNEYQYAVDDDPYWHEWNDSLTELGKDVDVIFVGLYKRDENWQTATRNRVREARKYNKPVYGYIMPHYPTMEGDINSRRYHDYDSWTEQLSLTDELCDHVIIWNGISGHCLEADDWYKATVDFL